MSVWNNNVKIFVDGTDRLAAADVNPAITALANRDQYLFEQLNSYGDKTMLLSYNQPMDSIYLTGQPVFFNTTGGNAILGAAKAGFESYTSVDSATPATAAHLVPKQTAFVFGLVKNVYGGNPGPIQYGDIYVRGLIDDPNINLNNILDTTSLNEGTPAPGPLYLSSEEAGKLSIFPAGASIFVGYYIGDNKIVLAPNIDSLNQLYFNYRIFLRSEAAGTITGAGANTYTVNPPDFTKVGWIGAASAAQQYGFVAPAAAKFFYNLPSDDEIEAAVDNSEISTLEAQNAYLLKRALPAHPSSYTMLFSNGILLTQYDADHTDGAYIVDDQGIWWVDDTTGYVPWNNGVDPLIHQLLITKLNPNYASTVVTSLTSTNPGIRIVDSNGLVNTTGDLHAELNLGVTPIPSTGNGNGTAVSSVVFDKASGSLNIGTAPVINSITTGPGLVLAVTGGQATIGLNDYKLSGEVTDIEPEESDFLYKGLHSYLRLKKPAAINQKVGFIGKFRLPSAIPAQTSLAISLDCFADGTSGAGLATASFQFEYSVSNNESSISNAVTSTTVTIPGSRFVSYKQSQIYLNNATVPVPYFAIPYDKFAAGSYVNFRISRTYDAGSSYDNAIGVLGINWVIE